MVMMAVLLVRPVRRDVEPLPPDHDAAEFAAIKVRHRVDVARIVKALCSEMVASSVSAGNVFSCHECLDDSITYLDASIQTILLLIQCHVSGCLMSCFDPKQVALELRATNQAEAILEIVELLRANGKVEEYYKFSDAVMEREGRSSTNTGDGVAFPHARTDLVEKMVLGIGRSQKGVRFGEAKEPVHLIFLVGVPKRMVNDYLVCVGAGASREDESISGKAHKNWDGR